MNTRTLVAVLIAAAATSGAGAAGPEPATVTFTAKDGLEVTADLYLAHPPSAPLIILFHMANSSRGEYRLIAPRLNKLGFNALAVDQRSGRTSSGIVNETAARAKKAKLKANYLDARPDLEAAIAYARATYAPAKLLIWGSSYSSSLVLVLAGEEPGLCDAVLSFSPGEYFEGGGYVAAKAAGIGVPVFLTSASYEAAEWKGIAEAITAPGKVAFVPKAQGAHGSPALWPDTDGYKEYWKALEPFLKAVLKGTAP